MSGDVRAGVEVVRAHHVVLGVDLEDVDPADADGPARAEALRELAEGLADRGQRLAAQAQGRTVRGPGTGQVDDGDVRHGHLLG
ncbi:hypothetical protein [Cellulomonas sp. SLBN-39]|uniref:hypothetical protein n=1 Tax=Cellulomonas sp. SLBN-39 TaxID=2768446 RepID=UPI001150E40C|nr:hypothetical protein [Cellulomonas sp. SLBN-39]